jgi:hypothetical protein
LIGRLDANVVHRTETICVNAFSAA